MGRPSIPPEMLLQATLLQAFVSVRSKRMLMERIDDDLLLGWFVGVEIDVAVRHPTVFTHNRDRLPETAVALAFLGGAGAQAGQAAPVGQATLSISIPFRSPWVAPQDRLRTRKISMPNIPHA